MVAHVLSVLYEWREVESAISVISRSRGRAPCLNFAANGNSEMVTRRRERQSGNVLFEGEMIENDPPLQMRKDRLAVVVYRK